MFTKLQISASDSQQPSIAMPFSIHLPIPLSVSWLSLGYTLPPRQGHYTVIAAAWGATYDATVVSAHLVSCNAPMKSVMKQGGSPATFPPISYLKASSLLAFYRS